MSTANVGPGGQSSVRRLRRVIMTAVAVLVASAGWTSSAAAQQTPGSTTAPVAGPRADLSHKLQGGNGVYLADPIPVNLQQHGYVQHEYLAAGTAASYQATTPLSQDGRWSFAPDGSAPYRTRIVVREPSDPSKFSGTVVVEWLNVSGGVDADAEWASLYQQIMRQGDVWVGVSAQTIGVMGGPVLVKVNAPGSENAGGASRPSILPGTAHSSSQAMVTRLTSTPRSPGLCARARPSAD